jgi:hypothetical protein
MATTVDDVAKLMTWNAADQGNDLQVLEGTWPAGGGPPCTCSDNGTDEIRDI